MSTEEVFRAFIDQTVYVNSIEKEEPFYRWQVTLTADQIQTLAGADITDQTGEIEKVRITKRGNSGIARNMVLYGKQSSVTIEGQMEIRELLCSPDVVIRNRMEVKHQVLICCQVRIFILRRIKREIINCMVAALVTESA